jgi:hypothetical protein
MSNGTTSRPGNVSDNVVVRLHKGIQQAKAAGFDVRMEPLGDGEAGWCQIGSKRILFLDAAQTAQDQLDELNEALENFRRAA